MALPLPRHELRWIAREQLLPLARLALDCALQPIVEIATGRTYGYEALMRGHEQLGAASPVDLIDRIAELGAIDGLERLLHDRAIAKFASVPDHAGRRLFVNLDGRAIAAGPDMIAGITTMLAQHGISSSALTIELSERSNNISAPHFSEVVDLLRAAGSRIALDDFGLGCAELRLLCDYDLDYVKIDAHFIRGMAESPRKRLVVNTIAALAHELGMRVIAEGVETAADFAGCRETGCDMVQGYFAARPTREVSELRELYLHVAR